MNGRRLIVLRVEYADDREHPRQIDLRDWCDSLEQRLAAHLATPVDVTIERDTMNAR